jgi:THO complex subunit 3
VQGKSGEYKTGEQTLFLTWHPSGTELLVGTSKDVITALDIRKADTGMLDTSVTNSSAAVNPAKYELSPTDRSPPRDKGAYYQMSFAHTGKHLFAATTEGPVKLFKYPSMEHIHSLSAHPSSTYAVQQSPAGTFVAVGGSDGQVTLWDTTSWLVPHVLREQAGAVRDLSFSFDGAYLVAGGGSDVLKENEKNMHIWHVETGELAHTIETVNSVTWVAWHPLRHAVAYAGDPGGLKIVGFNYA